MAFGGVVWWHMVRVRITCCVACGGVLCGVRWRVVWRAVACCAACGGVWCVVLTDVSECQNPAPRSRTSVTSVRGGMRTHAYARMHGHTRLLTHPHCRISDDVTARERRVRAILASVRVPRPPSTTTRMDVNVVGMQCVYDWNAVVLERHLCEELAVKDVGRKGKERKERFL